VPKRFLHTLWASAAILFAALPLAAQDAAVDLATEIKAGAADGVVLERCAGFFQALRIANGNPDPQKAQVAAQTVQSMFEGLIALKLPEHEGEVSDMVQKIRQGIDDQARFYLDRMVASIKEGGSPFDDLMAVDQGVCLLIAKARQEQAAEK